VLNSINPQIFIDMVDDKTNALNNGTATPSNIDLDWEIEDLDMNNEPSLDGTNIE